MFSVGLFGFGKPQQQQQVAYQQAPPKKSGFGAGGMLAAGVSYETCSVICMLSYPHFVKVVLGCWVGRFWLQPSMVSLSCAPPTAVVEHVSYPLDKLAL
jgi:hypothetical protein